MPEERDSNREFRTEGEYWERYGMLFGSYRFHRDILLDSYEKGEIDMREFLERFETEAAPHLKDCDVLAKLLASGLCVTPKGDAEP
jgi:hypothetical protein